MDIKKPMEEVGREVSKMESLFFLALAVLRSNDEVIARW